jgi:transposase
VQQETNPGTQDSAAVENPRGIARAYPNGIVARDRDVAARDCGSDGVSLSTVNRAHMAYDGGGIKALKPKPIGGRQRENMMPSEEKALLAQFSKAAGAGQMLNIHDLKAAYEQAIGHATSNSTVYNLLARHGWRKLMPRPFHPKRDLAAQDAFKKMAFQPL